MSYTERARRVAWHPCTLGWYRLEFKSQRAHAKYKHFFRSWPPDYKGIFNDISTVKWKVQCMKVLPQELSR